MSAAPLTHHEILGLIEPFTRSGRHLDLPASDRAERRLLFQPRETAGMREVLQLDCLPTGSFRLTRFVTDSDGTQASLEGVGGDCAALLSRFEAIPLERHFRAGPGYRVARHYTIESFPAAAARAPERLSRGVVQVDGLTLTMDVPALRGMAADLTLTPAPGEAPLLPDDLLAVLGWDWIRLSPRPADWVSKRRLRGSVPRRTATAEQALETAGRHLAEVLAEPPARFDERHHAARLGVVARRAIPTLTAIVVVAGIYLATQRFKPQGFGSMLLWHYASIFLLVFGFSLQEQSRFEIPPWPRPLTNPAWRPGRPTAAREAGAEGGAAAQAGYGR